MKKISADAFNYNYNLITGDIFITATISKTKLNDLYEGFQVYSKNKTIPFVHVINTIDDFKNVVQASFKPDGMTSKKVELIFNVI